MALEFKLPDVGEGTTEGEIVRWLVAPGETVTLDQPLVEIETDKAVVELPAPRAGVILARHGQEGQVVAVGTTLVVIGDAEEGTAPTDILSNPALASEAGRGGGVQAAPFTRRLAKSAGVALSAIAGSGPHGRIVPDDVRRFLAHPVASPSAETTVEERERVVLTGLRRKIADHLVEAARTIPHVTVVEKVDVTELVALRERLQRQSREGPQVSYLAWLVKVLGVALGDFPAFNARWDHDQCYRYRAVHVGVAVDTDDGLLVPVLRDVQTKTAGHIGTELRTLADAARNRTLAPAALTGSTITVTGGGALGGLFAAPLINAPEVAIVGMYHIRPEPAVWQDAIAIRQILYLSLTFDHRVADGVEAARFLGRMAELLADPVQLLMTMR